MKVGIFAIGEVDVRFLYQLASCLEERFLYKFLMESSLSAPVNAFNAMKRQYFSPALMSRMKMSCPPGIKYALGVTRLDLYGTSLNFIFGDANAVEKTALVSYHRLRPEFYHDAKEKHGRKAVDNDLLFDRILKEAMHQLAHVLGSRHCYNRSCVMYYSNNIFDIDNKTSLFCPECEKKLKKIAYGHLKDFRS